VVRAAGWSESERERRALSLAALLRRAWRAVARALGSSLATENLNPAGLAGAVSALRPRWAQEVDAAVLPVIGDQVVAAASFLAGQLVPVADVAELTTDYDPVAAYLREARNRLVGVGDEVWANVREQLVVGSRAGEDVREVAARVRNVAGVSQARSVVIARTEVHAAHEAGAFLQAKLAGLDGKKEWLATHDARTRPSHAAAGGQRVSFLEPFVVGGAALLFPGDPAGPADEVVNCRCSVAYDFDLVPAAVPAGKAPAPAPTPELALVAKFDPAEPRDAEGQWTDGPGVAVVDLARSVAGLAPDDRRAAVAKIMDEHTDLNTNVTQVNERGVWSEERDRLHRRIAEDMYARAADVPNEGKAIFLGGLPGAGKTTALREHFGGAADRYMVINPDDIKEELARRGAVPDVPGHSELSPLERAPLVHAESARISLLLASLAYRDRKNVVWDVTMGRRGYISQDIADLEDAGYDRIDGIFIDVPLSVSRRRVAERYAQGIRDYERGVGLGGRVVPDFVFDQMERPGRKRARNRVVFDDVRRDFTSWGLYDNSVDGSPPKLVLSRGVQS